MPKIALTADWHIPRGGHPRFQEYAESAKWMVESARYVGCDELYFLGDLYAGNEARPGPAAEMAAINALDQWFKSNSDEPWLGISGNHDGARGSDADTVVHVLAAGATGRCADVPHTSFRYRPLVTCFPFPSDAWLAAKGVRPTQEAMRNLVAAALENLAAEISVPDKLGAPILIAHLPLLEATTGSERLMSLCGDWAISVTDIPETFQAAFLGHIHRPQCLRESPPVWYTGALVRNDWGEEGVPVGYLTYDTENGKVEHIANPHAREFVTIQYDLLEEPKTIPERAFVRIRVPRDAEQDAAKMAGRLESEIPDVNIRLDVLPAPLPPRERAGTLKADMAVSEQLDQYAANRGIDDVELVTEAKQKAAEIAAGGMAS